MTTVTDEMTGAAIEAVWEAVKTDNPPDGWTDWIDDRVMRAALSAALAVMPAPTDAEYESAVRALEHAVVNETLSDLVAGERDKLQSRVQITKAARRTLLAMHAQARLAGLDDIRLDIHARGFNAGWRDALEQLREWLENEIEHEMSKGVQLGFRDVRRQIDAMLGGGHE